MGEKQLKRWVLVFSLGILILVFAFPPRNKVRQLEKVDFHVNTSDRLYFHNIRSFYYEKEERPDWGTNIFSIPNTLSDTTLPFIQFMIVDSWVRDNAFLMTEISPAVRDLQVSFWIDGDTIVLNRTQDDTEDHYKLGGIMLNALLEEDSIALLNKGVFYPVFGTPELKKKNFTVLEDYYRLVGKYH